MADSNCLEQMRKAFKGVDEDVLQGIMKELEYIRSKSKSIKEFDEKAFAFSKEVKRNMSVKILVAAQQSALINKLRKGANQPIFEKAPWDYLKANLDGVDYQSKGGNRSIELDHLIMYQKYGRQLDDALKDAGLVKIMKSGTLDREIYLAMYAKAEGTVAKVSPQAQQAADIVGNIYKGLQEEMEMVGSYRNRLEGYLRRRYDATKVEQAKFKPWASDILKELNKEKSYGSKADDIDYIMKDLGEIYESIVLGQYNKGLVDSFEGSTLTLKSHSGYDGKNARSRHFYFKDGDAEYRFLQKYGEGTVLENLMGAIESDSRATAVLNKFGANPRTTWETLKSDIGKSMRGNPELAKTYQEKIKGLDTLFKNTVYGMDIGTSATARWGRNIRAIESWAKLGGVIKVSGTADLATQVALFSAKTGKSYFGTFANTLRLYLKNLSPAFRKEGARRLQFYTDGALGEHWSRFNPEDKLGGYVAKANDWYFSLNLLKQQTNIYKMGNGDQYAMHLADISDRSFDTLHIADRSNLSRYGITSEDWEILKKAKEDVGGFKMITPYAVENLDLPPLEKRELRMKLSSYLVENSQFIGSPSPSITQRTALLGNTDPNSILGQTIRMMAQFKNFGLTMHKVFRHALFNDAENATASMLEALKTKSGIRNTAALFAGTTTLAGIGIILGDYASGKTARDYTTAEFLSEAMVRGGAMGLYGDFLFADYEDRYRNLSKDIMGPVIGGTFSNMAELWAALIDTGDEKKRNKAAKIFKTLTSEVPFTNLIYVKGTLDYFILDEFMDALAPGYKSRQKQKMRKKGQEYLFE